MPRDKPPSSSFKFMAILLVVPALPVFRLTTWVSEFEAAALPPEEVFVKRHPAPFLFVGDSVLSSETVDKAAVKDGSEAELSGVDSRESWCEIEEDDDVDKGWGDEAVLARLPLGELTLARPKFEGTIWFVEV